MGVSLRLLLELGKPRVLILMSLLVLAGALLSPDFLHPQFQARLPDQAIFVSLATVFPAVFTPQFWSVLYALMAVLVVALLWLGTALINELTDQAIDIINAPFRPLPSRRISPEQTLRWALGLQAIALLLILWAGSRQAIILGLIGAALGNAYSMPTIRLRRNGLVANLIIGIGVSMAMIGGMLSQGVPTGVGLLSAGMLGLLAATTSMVKDFKDVDGDRRSGIRTLPVMLGIHSAAMINMVIVAFAYLAALVLLIQRIGLQHGVLVLITALAAANLGLLSIFLGQPRPGFALQAYRWALMIYMGVTVLYVGVQAATQRAGLWPW